MRRLALIIAAVAAALAGILALKSWSGAAGIIWEMSAGGSWLLPLVGFSALLDSVHPCSFSILLITVAFLFAMRLPRRKILAIGGTYIAGIFAAYLLIGLGILQALHLFDTPHFMGKLGSALLIGFGVLNVLGATFPRFPIRLAIPRAAHRKMGELMDKATVPAAFGLGALVGLCQFPCMGGPYLMVIGLLRDQSSYWSGVGHLVLYNLILVVPLAATLLIASDKALLEKAEAWKRDNMKGAKLWAGAAMIIIGVLILTL